MLERELRRHLRVLCEEIGHRHVGSEGNKQATDYIADELRSLSLVVREVEFDCIDWEYGDCQLAVGSKPLKAFISPYSLSCNVKGKFEVASTIDELDSKNFQGKIAILHGTLCREQLMPKNFVFYNPDDHKRIISLLESKEPLAIVAITAKNPELAGAWYPFPLLEDGDFDIPSVFMTEEEGANILALPNEEISLFIDSTRKPSRGRNVIGVKPGTENGKIVICAHVDTKKDTPGALDNGTGIATVLSLAKQMEDYQGRYTLEFLAVNGEDYYSAPGQMSYLAENPALKEEVVLAINMDGAGYKGAASSFAHFNCGEELITILNQVFSDKTEFVEAEPWYQSDHMIFAMQGIPALAITSEKFQEVSGEIAHTKRDTTDKVDTHRLAAIVRALSQLLRRMK